jgi:tetratricopeptide (TPR) repeat protein
MTSSRSPRMRIIVAAILLLHAAAAAMASEGGNEASSYKEEGDRFAAEDRYDRAAESYIQALKLSRDFPEEEQVRMAVAIAWGDHTDEAIAELRAVLTDHPENTAARTHLARFLSWAGKLPESLAEADAVLARKPEDRDALLVKANTLRWMGRPAEALPIYEVLLQRGEDADARQGAAEALWAMGRRSEARNTLSRLRPQYPYQTREQAALQERMDRESRPDGAVFASTYHDSDQNDVSRYGIEGGSWFGSWKAVLTYRHTEARDDFRRSSADEFTVRSTRALTQRLNAGLALGYVREQGSGASAAGFVTGGVSGDYSIPQGSVNLWLSRQALTDTAQIIANHILISQIGAAVSQGIADRVTLTGGAAYRSFSDDNSSREVQAGIRYRLRSGNPGLTASYRLLAMDFDHQSGGGYFDPERFVSHIVALACSYEEGRFSGSLEPLVGYQSYVRNQKNQHETVYGGQATAGYGITGSVRVEASIEGGNYAASASGAYSYYQVGVRLHMAF